MQEESLSENEDLPSGMDVTENVENAIDQIEAFECLDQIERQCVYVCLRSDEAAAGCCIFRYPVSKGA